MLKYMLLFFLISHFRTLDCYTVLVTGESGVQLMQLIIAVV